MMANGQTWVEAIRALAERFGVEFDETLTDLERAAAKAGGSRATHHRRTRVR